MPSTALCRRKSTSWEIGIVIGRGARIQPGAFIEGPIRIGRDVVIRTGAYLRGGNWIGDNCVVGANTEVKRSIFLPGAKAPHLSYVGDSILGSGVNLGAGSVLSNLRHDGRQIAIPIGDSQLPTGRRKLGAILGDRVLTGCNCVLFPGVVVGRASQIYPGVQLRAGVYPAGCSCQAPSRARDRTTSDRLRPAGTREA